MINPRKIVPRHIVIKMAKIKDKERIVKAASERQTVIHKGYFKRLSAAISRIFTAQKGIA